MDPNLKELFSCLKEMYSRQDQINSLLTLHNNAIKELRNEQNKLSHRLDYLIDEVTKISDFAVEFNSGRKDTKKEH